MPRATLKESVTPADIKAINAHAVCEGELSPLPLCATSTYDRHDSPQPPSEFCFDSSQETARRMYGAERSSPIARSPAKTDQVP